MITKLSWAFIEIRQAGGESVGCTSHGLLVGEERSFHDLKPVSIKAQCTSQVM